MYKNQLQELAQRSCFNLPSYSCVREGPDHAPRFKATVNFNGETFESPSFCSTLRQAEHAAAEVALNTLANRGPSRALAARVLDETGVYKNLLQETAHRAGLNLPIYTTVRSGPGHVPVFTCTVELAGLSFSGEPAKTKKQAQKNAAMAAWSTLKQLAQRDSSSSTSPCSPSESEGGEEQEQVVIARVLASIQPTEAKSYMQNVRQDGPPKSIRPSRDPIPAASSLYPVQYETWAYPGFPTEMAMYRVWQQAQLSHLQRNRLLSLPVPPPPISTPQVLPVMPPFLQPDHLYFTVGEQQHFPVGPGDSVAASRPFYFSRPPPIPAPTTSMSMVTIQEIHDEKTDGSPSEVLNAQVIIGYKTEEAIQERAVHENDKQKSDTLEAKLGDAGQQERNPTGKFAWVSSKSTDSGFQPLETRGCESSQSHHRPCYSPRPTSHKTSEPPFYMAAPVRIRNAGPLSSLVGVRPQPQNLANRMPALARTKTGISPSPTRPRTGFVLPSRYMAPAVQIRSVVPVCSAPPTRKIWTAGQEGNSTSQERSKEHKDTAVVTSELGKLQM